MLDDLTIKWHEQLMSSSKKEWKESDTGLEFPKMIYAHLGLSAAPKECFFVFFLPAGGLFIP